MISMREGLNGLEKEKKKIPRSVTHHFYPPNLFSPRGRKYFSFIRVGKFLVDPLFTQQSKNGTENIAESSRKRIPTTASEQTRIKRGAKKESGF